MADWIDQLLGTDTPGAGQLQEKVQVAGERAANAVAANQGQPKPFEEPSSLTIQSTPQEVTAQAETARTNAPLYDTGGEEPRRTEQQVAERNLGLQTGDFNMVSLGGDAFIKQAKGQDVAVQGQIPLAPQLNEAQAQALQAQKELDRQTLLNDTAERMQGSLDIQTELEDMNALYDAHGQDARDAFDRAKADTDRLFANLQDTVNAASSPTSAENFFTSRGEASAFGASMAVAAGAFASLMNGGPNFAMQIIDRAIERDMRSQEFNREFGVKAQTNLLNTYQSMTQNREAARAALLQTRLQQAKNHIDLITRRTQNNRLKLAGQDLATKLDIRAKAAQVEAWQKTNTFMMPVKTRQELARAIAARPKVQRQVQQVAGPGPLAPPPQAAPAPQAAAPRQPSRGLRRTAPATPRQPQAKEQQAPNKHPFTGRDLSDQEQKALAAEPRLLELAKARRERRLDPQQLARLSEAQKAIVYGNGINRFGQARDDQGTNYDLVPIEGGGNVLIDFDQRYYNKLSDKQRQDKVDDARGQVVDYVNRSRSLNRLEDNYDDLMKFTWQRLSGMSPAELERLGEAKGNADKFELAFLGSAKDAAGFGAALSEGERKFILDSMASKGNLEKLHNIADPEGARAFWRGQIRAARVDMQRTLEGSLKKLGAYAGTPAGFEADVAKGAL